MITIFKCGDSCSKDGRKISFLRLWRIGGKKIRDLNCQEGEAEEKRKNQHGRVKHWNKFPGNFQEGGAGHVQPVSRSRAR